jgi:hypothetical protein
MSSILFVRIKKNNEKEKKPKKMTNLDPSLHFGSPNHELPFKFFFWFGSIGFLAK